MKYIFPWLKMCMLTRYAQALDGWTEWMKKGFNNGFMEWFQHYNGILVVYELSK